MHAKTDTTLLLPRFLREFVTIPAETGLFIDGGAKLQLLRGGAAKNLIPRLVPLMDGTRSEAQLELALQDIPASHVRTAVSLLSNSGLVEDAAEEPAQTSCVNVESLSFFRRFAPVTKLNESGWAAYQRLEADEVVLVCADRDLAAGRALRSLLEKTGLPHVSTIGTAHLDDLYLQRAGTASPPLLVALSLHGEDQEFSARLDEWCIKAGVSWFRAVVDLENDCADLGPLFRPRESPCYRCFQAIQTIAGSRGSARLPSLAHEMFWASLVAVEIVYLLSRIAPSIASGSFRRYAPSTWQSRDLRFFRLPDCPRCRKQPPGTTRTSIYSAMVFEEYVGLQSRELVDPAKYQETIKIGAALSRQFKDYAVCESYSLPAEPLDLIARVPGAIIALHELATLLQLTAGLRHANSPDRKVDRWAATAGNLGSVELYIAVRNVAGLDSGFYFYKARDHSLAALRRRSGVLTIEDFMQRVMPRSVDGSLPDVLVIFTGAFHRVSQKYGPFGYRLINMDAGAALSQLRMVAATLQIPSSSVPRFADDLVEDQLSLSAPGEQCTAMLALSRNVGVTSRIPSPDRPVCSDSSENPRDFFEITLFSLLESLHLESRVNERDIYFGPIALPTGEVQVSLDVTHSVLLPPVFLEELPLRQVLAARRSTHEFSGRQVGLKHLSAILQYANQSEQMEDLSLFVLVTNVAELSPGVYEYSPDANKKEIRLHLVRTVLSASEKNNLLVQEEFAESPIQIWVTGNLASACARAGAFGHRQLLVRAGMAAHRVWFGALAEGLVGSIVAGLVPGSARTTLGLDGHQRVGIIAVMAGNPREQ